MMLGIFMNLCEMCKRLLAICEAQQIELERLKANRNALEQWRREAEHIRGMLKDIED